MAKVEFYESETEGQRWRWRVRSRNGQIVASGEAHTTKYDAVVAFGRATANMEDAYKDLLKTPASGSPYKLDEAAAASKGNTAVRAGV